MTSIVATKSTPHRPQDMLLVGSVRVEIDETDKAHNKGK
jgi:hypothetical protein